MPFMIVLAILFWLSRLDSGDRLQVKAGRIQPSSHLAPKENCALNFQEVWEMVPFAAYYKNTFLISFGLLGVQLITVTLAAYAFGRLQFKGRDTLFILFLTHYDRPAELDYPQLPNHQ